MIEFKYILRPHYLHTCYVSTTFKVFYFINKMINPFRPEFIIVIFIHYKPRIAVAILDL